MQLRQRGRLGAELAAVMAEDRKSAAARSSSAAKKAPVPPALTRPGLERWRRPHDQASGFSGAPLAWPLLPHSKNGGPHLVCGASGATCHQIVPPSAPSFVRLGALFRASLKYQTSFNKAWRRRT